jgi:hypothetical protein
MGATPPGLGRGWLTGGIVTTDRSGRGVVGGRGLKITGVGADPDGGAEAANGAAAVVGAGV